MPLCKERLNCSKFKIENEGCHDPKGYFCFVAVDADKDAVAKLHCSDGLSAMPMTLGDMIERAAKHLPEGYIIDIQIEKDGYGVGLVTENGRLDLDGGDGMISDINEGISVANGFGR